MMIKSFNKMLACEPQADTGMTRTVKSGVALPDHRNTLLELRVVFGSDSIQAGASIFLPRELAQQRWYTTVYEVDGQKVIFVPESHVMLVRYQYEPFTIRYVPSAQPETLTVPGAKFSWATTDSTESKDCSHESKDCGCGK
jgi:hypothetical protein